MTRRLAHAALSSRCQVISTFPRHSIRSFQRLTPQGKSHGSLDADIETKVQQSASNSSQSGLDSVDIDGINRQPNINPGSLFSRSTPQQSDIVPVPITSKICSNVVPIRSKSSKSGSETLPGWDGETIYDLKYIRQNFRLPTQEELPYIKYHTMFENGALHNPAYLADILFQRTQFEITKDRFSVVTQYGTTMYQVRLSCSLEGDRMMDSVGHGWSERSAREAALLHLAAKLFEHGMLDEALSGKVREEAEVLSNISGDKARDFSLQLQSTPNTIINITEVPPGQTPKQLESVRAWLYNHCVQHGLAPKSFVRASGKSKYITTLELPELYISASVETWRPFVGLAEAVAAIQIKEKMQELALDRLTNHFLWPNTANIDRFVAQYNALNPSANLSLRIARGNMNFYVAQPLLNGEPLGNASVSPSPKYVEKYAELAAAAYLIKMRPELLDLLNETGFWKAEAIFLKSLENAWTATEQYIHLNPTFFRAVQDQVTLEAPEKPTKIDAEVHVATQAEDDISQPEIATVTETEKGSLLTKDGHAIELHQDRLETSKVAQTQLDSPFTANDLTIELSQDSLVVIRKALEVATKYKLADGPKPLQIESDAEELSEPMSRLMTAEIAVRKSKLLLSALRNYEEQPALASIRDARSNLPVSQYSTQILEAVENNIYSIVVGMTGSGKTTQLPQILLDNATNAGMGASCNIICTQPRRIAASSVARRVAHERGQKLQDQIGYQVRFDNKVPKNDGSITYCTTGILLERLKRNSDSVFESASHLIIDEVHERDIFIDYLLVVLKKKMMKRIELGKTVPKVVLMSATIESELISSYFTSPESRFPTTQCPTIVIPGRTFSVNAQYLDELMENMTAIHGARAVNEIYIDDFTQKYLKAEKYRDESLKMIAGSGADAEEPVLQWLDKKLHMDWGENFTSETEFDGSDLIPTRLVATTIAHIAKTTDDGAVLVFLPGMKEILDVQTMLEQQKIFDVDFRDTSKYWFYLLHSEMKDDQSDVFTPAPQGVRKIILATNIAESSITVPDVKYVVDTGKARILSYVQFTGITQLKSSWISKSSSKQRMGRAGRVQNGEYYAIFSKSRFDTFRDNTIPEMHRADLQEICLDIKTHLFQYPIGDFLADTIEPPTPEAVKDAISDLKTLGALSDSEDLTPLGELLSKLPLHPRLGKLIVMGIIYKCLDAMIILGASSGENLFSRGPVGMRQHVKAIRQQFAVESRSDIIAVLNAFNSLRKLQNSRGRGIETFAKENFINLATFNKIKTTAESIEDILQRSGLIPKLHTLRSTVLHRYGNAAVNRNSGNDELVKALYAFAFYPNIGRLSGNSWKYKIMKIDKKVQLSPHSVNYSKKETPPRLVTYTTLFRDTEDGLKVMHGITEVTPLMVTLFGGPLSEVKKAWKNQNNMNTSFDFVTLDDKLDLVMNDRLHLGISEEASQSPALPTMLDFRNALRKMEMNACITMSSRDASKDLIAYEDAKEIIVNTVVKVLDQETLAVEAVSELEVQAAMISAAMWGLPATEDETRQRLKAEKAEERGKKQIPRHQRFNTLANASVDTL